MNASAIDLEPSPAEFCSDDDYPRPLGVHGAPHVGDVPRYPEASAKCEFCGCTPDDFGVCHACAPMREVDRTPINLSHEATPASDDLRNALMILGAAHSTMIGDAVTTLIRSALEKIEADK